MQKMLQSTIPNSGTLDLAIERRVAAIKSNLGADGMIDADLALSASTRAAIIEIGKSVSQSLRPSATHSYHRHLAKMLAFMPRSVGTSAADTVEVYAERLNQPEWLVEAVVEGFISHKLTTEKWAPTPGEFRVACEKAAAPYHAKLSDLRRVLEAKMRPEDDENSKMRVRAMVDSALGALQAGSLQNYDYPRQTPEMILDATIARNNANPVELSDEILGKMRAGR